MFVAAVAHYFAFSHVPYVDPHARPIPCCLSFMAMWDVSDVTQDVSDHIRHVGKAGYSLLPLIHGRAGPLT